MQEDATANIRSLMFAESGKSDGSAGGGSRVHDRGAEANGAISRNGSIGTGALVSWDEQLAAMQSGSLADLDSKADPDLYRAVLDTKGLTLFRVIEAIVQRSDELGL